MPFVWTHMHLSDLDSEIAYCIDRALREDIGDGDITTNSIVPVGSIAACLIVAKQDGVVAGLDVAGAVFQTLDKSIEFDGQVAEGSEVLSSTTLASIRGPARAILTGERTALNFLGRMSGIATMTRKYVDAVAGTRVAVLDTRKTAPGLRVVDKLAVKRGGGQNHRSGLHDMILVKNNHIDACGSVMEAVTRARSTYPGRMIEVEARNLGEVKAALEARTERILLDNMHVDDIHEAVLLNAGSAKLEVSGNVTLDTVTQIAATGVDYISVGALTHSVRNFDAHLTWSIVEIRRKG
jgi:nicotinate-nucleotide pyrophosphorylase (carboxylating)